jgi:Bacterial SH3 domain
VVRGSKPNRTWLVLAAVALVVPLAGAATVRDRSRLREGPSKDTALLGYLEPETTVTIEGQRNGWYAVRSSDGKAGFVFQDHLRFDPGEAAAAPPLPAAAVATTTAVPATNVPQASPPPTIASEQAIPGQAIASGQSAAAAEMERLRAEVARLATAQEELAQRLPRRGAGAVIPPVPLGSDGSAGAAATFLLAGGLAGVIVGYLARGRRDRRSRIRL